jgi:hypothetical protein
MVANMAEDPASGASAGSSEELGEDPGPVPVMLNAKRDRETQQIKGALRNMSSRRLVISITAMNAATGVGSSAQVVLEPSSTIGLSEAGLSIEPGDRIVMHSPPYQDREQPVN